MNRGVLLLALGNPLYSKLAYNLSVSLRHVSPDINITLIKAGDSLSHLTDIDKYFFNKKAECPVDYFTNNGAIDYLKAKLYLNKLTPYDETIFFDADMIFSPYKKVEQIFDELKDIDFTMANRGVTNEGGHSDWITISEIEQFYGFNKWYDLSSEFIYWKKSEQTDKIFNDAQEYYKDDLLNVKPFNGGKPDEPFFCLSLLKNDLPPHKLPYAPSYWEPANNNKRINSNDLWNNYYLLSIGGRVVGDRVKTIYDNIVQYYGYHRNVDVYKHSNGGLHNKSKVIKERQLI
jgi:hypothetical protein